MKVIYCLPLFFLGSRVSSFFVCTDWGSNILPYFTHGFPWACRYSTIEPTFSSTLLYLSGFCWAIASSTLFLHASLWIPVLPLFAPSHPLQHGVSPYLESNASSLLMCILRGIISRVLGGGVSSSSPLIMNLDFTSIPLRPGMGSQGFPCTPTNSS